MKFTHQAKPIRKLGRPPKGIVKVTPDIAFNMRCDRLNGMTLKEIAEKYDVALSTVQKFINGNSKF